MKKEAIITFLLVTFIAVSSYAQQNRVEVTYIGNAGFMINISDKKILIDALFKGFEDNYELPQHIQEKLKLAQAPFDDIDLILVTHAHGDHINGEMIRQHMTNNPNAIFASTRQTVDALNAVDTLDEFQERSIAFNPIKGESDKKDIKGISIETFYLPHGPDSQVINIAFLVSVNGVTFFQTGDVDFDQFTFEEFRSLDLPEKKIDLSFIQHFYLTNDSLSKKFVQEAIGGKFIIPVHYHFTTPPFDSTIVRQNYPDAILFKEELETWYMPAKENEFPEQKGDYFGQALPDDTPVVFAPGIFSLSDRLESNIAFSPNGKECYFGVIEIIDNKASNKIYYSKYKNNKWTAQVEAPFSVNRKFDDPSFSKDGSKLYVSEGGDIWMLERVGEGWGEPQLLPSPINSDSSEGSYTELNDDVAYISSRRAGGYGGIDIWRISRLPDQSLQAENLGPIFNTSLFDYSPFIAPDGSYLIFGSYRSGKHGQADLFISFNKGNKEWTDPLNMNSCGAQINNSTAHHSNPSLSPDGKFLFFRRHETRMEMDVFWVSTDILKKLREKAMQEGSPQKITNLKGDYLGQTPPGDVPIIFAPGIISVDSTVEHGYPTFSPDGNTVFWQSNLRHKDKETEIFLKTMRRVEGQWTAPETSPFGGMPAFSPDGNEIYFIASETDKEKGLFKVTQKGESWSEKESLNLISRFPELKYLYCPSVTSNGTLYFFAHSEGLGSLNDFGIYRSELINGVYEKPELLPSSINATEGVLNWTPYIAPDESYLLFSSSRSSPDDDLGGIFVCFRRSDGSWTEAINLGFGTSINSSSQERFPYVSPDGKFLFFTRWVARGNEDVMWVSADIINEIKTKVFAESSLKEEMFKAVYEGDLANVR